MNPPAFLPDVILFPAYLTIRKAFLQAPVLLTFFLYEKTCRSISLLLQIIPLSSIR